MNKIIVNNTEKKKTFLGFIIMWWIVTFILLGMFKISGFNINYPLSNTGRDDTSYMAEIKMSYDDNNWKETNNLGAPFGTNRSSNISYYLFNDVHILSMIIVCITGSVFLSQNMTYILLFYLNSGVTYAILRNRKINPFFSVIGALTFTFSYYVFYRNVSHMMLTPIYTIPLAILICLWIFEDDSVLRISKTFFKNRRNIAIIIFSFLIVNSGIGYYTVFACFFFMIVGIYKSFDSKSLLGIKQFFIELFITVICLLFTIAGYILSSFNGKNAVMTSLRSYGDAEIYALKVVRMFLPPKGTGIQKIDDIIAAYNASAVCQTETSEYLGIIGIIGCIVLFLAIFINKHKSQIKLMSVMTICAILYATLGGLGVVFFLFATDMVRCTNRISIYIAFISIYTVCLLLQQSYIKFNENGNRVKRVLLCMMSGIVLLISLDTQIPWYHFDNSLQVKNCDIQKQFVDKLELMESDGAMIYQLPYWEYPPGPGINNMNPNELLQPYLYSSNIKWSFGAFSNEKSLLWNEYVSDQSTNDMVDSLCYMGFDGIFINSAAYTDDEFGDLIEQLQNILGNPDLVSSDNRWYYFSINDYTEQLRQSMSSDEWEHNVEIVKKYGEN